MMTVLRYGNIDLQMYGEYNITKSSQDVVYSDIWCDYTGYTRQQLPEKYQEVQIIQKDNLNNEKALFVGYIESYTFGKMRETDIETNIKISLYSPKKMTTIRTATAIGTFNLINVLQNNILTPLLDDGFVLKEMNITNHQVTLDYNVETIEYCMNNLSNKYSFWWYIDEYKNIYVKDISLMMSKEPDFKYDDDEIPDGLEYIQPITNSDNYANVINFKNVRIYQTANMGHNQLLNLPVKTIKANDIIEFNYPIDIKKENIIKSGQSNINTEGTAYQGLFMVGTYSNGNTFRAYIEVEDDNYIVSNNIGFDGNENATQDILLIRDSFFSNLIVGFKFNNTSYNISSITGIYSDSILVWNINKFYNDTGINEKKGKISNTGIVELTVNMNGSWKTIQELTQIGASYLNKNSLNMADEIQMATDRNIFTIGNTIYIDKLLIQGTYIITEITQTYENNEVEYLVTAKNGNMLNNFVDVFRSEKEAENEEKTYQLYITHYQEEEIAERFEVVR